MIKLARISILLVTTLLFWAGSHIAPSLTQAENLRFLAAIITILLTVSLYFFRKLGSINNLELLDSRELEYFAFRSRDIRRKVWWMVGWGFLCSFLIWVVTGIEMPFDSHKVAAIIGFLFACCIYYLAIFPFWLNELQTFQDKLKIKMAMKSRQDLLLKQLEDAK